MNWAGKTVIYVWKKSEMIRKFWTDRSIEPIALILTLIVSGGFTFGFGIASVAGVLDIIKNKFELSETGEQFVVGVLVLGCFLGAAGAGPISAGWGRKRTIMLAAALGGLGYTLILAGIGFGGLLVGRSLAGLCIGLISMVVPMYAAETTSAQRRGAVVSMFQLAITLGILGAYGTTLAFAASVPWQILLGAGALPLGLGLLAILFLPESPRWLAARGEHAAVEKATLTLGLADEWQEAPAAPARADNHGGTALTRGKIGRAHV